MAGGREEEFLRFVGGFGNTTREINTSVGEWHAEVFVSGNEGEWFII